MQPGGAICGAASPYPYPGEALHQQQMWLQRQVDDLSTPSQRHGRGGKSYSPETQLESHRQEADRLASMIEGHRLSEERGKLGDAAKQVLGQQRQQAERQLEELRILMERLTLRIEMDKARDEAAKAELEKLLIQVRVANCGHNLMASYYRIMDRVVVLFIVAINATVGGVLFAADGDEVEDYGSSVSYALNMSGAALALAAAVLTAARGALLLEALSERHRHAAVVFGKLWVRTVDYTTLLAIPYRRPGAKVDGFAGGCKTDDWCDWHHEYLDATEQSPQLSNCVYQAVKLYGHCTFLFILSGGFVGFPARHVWSQWTDEVTAGAREFDEPLAPTGAGGVTEEALVELLAAGPVKLRELTAHFHIDASKTTRKERAEMVKTISRVAYTEEDKVRGGGKLIKLRKEARARYRVGT